MLSCKSCISRFSLTLCEHVELSGLAHYCGLLHSVHLSVSFCCWLCHMLECQYSNVCCAWLSTLSDSSLLLFRSRQPLMMHWSGWMTTRMLRRMTTEKSSRRWKIPAVLLLVQPTKQVVALVAMMRILKTTMNCSLSHV